MVCGSPFLLMWWRCGRDVGWLMVGGERGLGWGLDEVLGIVEVGSREGWGGCIGRLDWGEWLGCTGFSAGALTVG